MDSVIIKTKTSNNFKHIVSSFKQIEKPSYIPTINWALLQELTKKFNSLFPGLLKSFRDERKKWENFIYS